MTITDIKIRRLMGEAKLRAIVSITLDDALAVHDIKLIAGQEKLFVAMPSKRTPEGAFHDIVHPISKAFRSALEAAVLSAYEQALSESPGEENRT